jgi:uncharacterized coiled-coil protein SlyX
MTLQQRVDKLEAFFGSQDKMVRELRDAVTVTAELEAAQSRRLKEHAHELAAHADWLRRHDDSIQKFVEEHNRAMKEIDKRIADLVSAIGRLLPRPSAT